MSHLLTLAESGRLPDPLIRLGIRLKHWRTLRRQRKATLEAQQDTLTQFLEQMRSGPIAPMPAAANEQHYEVPAAFFQLFLGPHMKYSSGYWEPPLKLGRLPHDHLEDTEAAMLRRTCERAGVEDGMRVLDLGCGWGSVSLWVAMHYPQCRVTAVSNSRLQRAFIEEKAAAAGLTNLEVHTADMNTFQAEGPYDRIISIEMFEHMRNWPALLGRLHGWLSPGGRCFLHVFAHQHHAYLFESGPDDWMGKHFFYEGMMPSNALLLYCQDHLKVERHWAVDGGHYHKTLEAWLQRLDARREEAMAILSQGYAGESQEQIGVRLQRWRMFIMACSELFRYGGGRDWHVAQYRLQRREDCHAA